MIGHKTKLKCTHNNTWTVSEAWLSKTTCCPLKSKTISYRYLTA